MVLEMEKQWQHVGSTRHHHCRHVESHIVVSKKGKLVDMQNLLLHFLLVLVVSVATTYKKKLHQQQLVFLFFRSASLFHGYSGFVSSTFFTVGWSSFSGFVRCYIRWGVIDN
jgi:hypothetical protein